MRKPTKAQIVKAADSTANLVVAVSTGYVGLKAKKAIEDKFRNRNEDTSNVFTLDEALDEANAAV